VTPNATEFGKITQNNGHYTVQGHSRSPLSVPIESHVNGLTYTLSCTVSYRIIGQIFTVDGGCLFLTRTRSLDERPTHDCEIWPQETRSRHRTTFRISIGLSLNVEAWITSLTDRRADFLVANAALNYVARPKKYLRKCLQCIRTVSAG